MGAEVQRLTDPLGGAIQIYRFCSAGFDQFQRNFLLGYRKAKSVQLVLMELGEGGREEVLVVECGGQVELHIHGGEANAKALELSLGELKMSVAESSSELESHLREATGERTISYLLNEIRGEGLGGDGYEIEGYEFLEPLKVVIIGPPNAGKSTFFNWMVGANQALVSDIAGTTRDLIKARVGIGGCEVDLVDTAGLEPSVIVGHAVEGDGILSQSLRLSLASVRSADLVLAFNWPEAEDWVSGGKILHVESKGDLRDGKKGGLESFVVSVHSGLGLEELLAELKAWVEEVRPNRISSNWERG